MALQGIGIPSPRRLRKHKKGDQLPAVAAKEVETHKAIHEDVNAAALAPEDRHEERERKESVLMIRFDEPGEVDFPHLGEMLVYLRKSYFERQGQSGRDRPRVELKAAAIVEYLREHGYSMTSGSYSLLEQGKTLPRNPAQFFDIISACLNIDRSSKYYVLLRGQYIYDHAVRFVGKQYADESILHGSALLEDLKKHAPTDPSMAAAPH